jgi:hypothetical protein
MRATTKVTEPARVIGHTPSGLTTSRTTFCRFRTSSLRPPYLACRCGILTPLRHRAACCDRKATPSHTANGLAWSLDGRCDCRSSYAQGAGVLQSSCDQWRATRSRPVYRDAHNGTSDVWGPVWLVGYCYAHRSAWPTCSRSIFQSWSSATRCPLRTSRMTPRSSTATSMTR